MHEKGRPLPRLLVVRRGRPGRAVAVLVNLTGEAPVPLPPGYREGWRLLGARGLDDGALGPRGYVVQDEEPWRRAVNSTRRPGRVDDGGQRARFVLGIECLPEDLSSTGRRCPISPAGH